MGARIYLVRHGETSWNAGGRFQGHSDIPLTDKGKEQAQYLAERLRKEKIDAFYSSDLLRARETAEILAKPHGLPVQNVKELREINFGQWEGLTSREISENFSEISSEWWSKPLTTQIPSGERLLDVVHRCQEAILRIAEEQVDKSSVVVAHGGVIRALVGTVLGMDLNYFWKLRLDNVSLTVIEIFESDKAILELYNDTCHLDGQKACD
ncbi:hypothetical protein N752_08560 [Desulforamulus aquiferis]|nr:alpha-ribazole phosphatase [Desulforamulus aquiferis]RYD05385.1 hypothetical protein N752_08560 [Desulforamulus aquiferis]